MAFHEVRFPDNISRGARGGPERRWNAPTEVVHPPGYDHPDFRRTKRWLESETSPRRSC